MLLTGGGCGAKKALELSECIGEPAEHEEVVVCLSRAVELGRDGRVSCEVYVVFDEDRGECPRDEAGLGPGCIPTDAAGMQQAACACELEQLTGAAREDCEQGIENEGRGWCGIGPESCAEIGSPDFAGACGAAPAGFRIVGYALEVDTALAVVCRGGEVLACD